MKSQRHSWISAFSFHQLQNICHSHPTLGKVTPASLKNKDKLMFLHQLYLRDEERVAVGTINSSSTLLKFAIYFWGFLSAWVICNSCCRFVLLLNMCSADFLANESFKNICKICAELHCWGFLKPQNNAAQFRTMRGRGSLLAARVAHSSSSYFLIFLEITQKHFGHQTQKNLKKNPKQHKNISDVCHHVTSRYAILYLPVMRCNMTGCNAM